MASRQRKPTCGVRVRASVTNQQPTGQHIAAFVIKLYQQGVRDEKKLFQLGMRHYPSSEGFRNRKPAEAAFVELKLPEIALATLEAKRAFIEKATDVVERAAGGRLQREPIWSNIVYAPEEHGGLLAAAMMALTL